jgi:DNA-binding transcriptional ArsR family regulator
MMGLVRPSRFDYDQSMVDTPDISLVARLIGEPTRGRMLTVLMDGRAHTATELALESGVTPSTASSHLAQLVDAHIATIVRQGRHRYFRLASPEVARVIEGLMTIAPRTRSGVARGEARDDPLRTARSCYDHLAGEAAVRLFDRLLARGYLDGDPDALWLTRPGESWCHRIGIDLDAVHTTRRPLCRSCLDWSERRQHLGGALGAALLHRLLTIGYARRVRASRVVILSSMGQLFVDRLLLSR